jgi:hypothetical protein
MSTKPRVNKTENKHHYSIKGSLFKRKKSSNELTTNKRDKLESPETSSLDSEEYLDSSNEILYSDIITDDEMSKAPTRGGKSEMGRALMEALREQEVSDFLISKFSLKCNKLIKAEIDGIKKEVDELKITSNAYESRLTDLEKRADETDQTARENNLIITGDVGESPTKEKIAKLLTEHVQTQVTTNDVRYIVKLERREQNSTKSVKVVLASKAKCHEIYKKKSTLKGKNMWITIDLTAARSKLFYQTRQWAKGKEGARTWTVDGKIFLKKTQNGSPTRIKHESDFQ